MKKISLCLVFIFFLLAALPALAAPAAYVVDDAGLLSPGEKAGLEKRIKQVRNKFNFDIVIVALKDAKTTKPPQVFTADYYMDNGYGVGPARDGLILLLDMKGRDWSIVGTGHGQTVFTGWGTNDIGESILSKLSGGEYYKAFDNFIELAEVYLQAYADGKPIGPDNPYFDSSVYWLCLFLAALAGVIVTILFKNSLMKSMDIVAAERYAFHYAGNMELEIDQDNFLYDKVVSTLKPPPPSKRSGGSSGSGSFRSSSGSSHSGSSGKF